MLSYAPTFRQQTIKPNQYDDWRNTNRVAYYSTDIYYYNTTITPQCPFIAASTVNFFGAAQECARSARGWASCFAFIAEGHMEYYTR